MKKLVSGNSYSTSKRKLKVFREKFNSGIVFIVFFLSMAIITVPTGCKSSKKAKARAEQEARLAKEKEDQKRREEEAARRIKESQEKSQRTSVSKETIEGIFTQVSAATSVEAANNSISEALTHFSGPDAPVLIIISKNGADYDYDEPTTITNYLNYLKDQKKNFNRVEKAEYDTNGKIKELILTSK